MRNLSLGMKSTQKTKILFGSLLLTTSMFALSACGDKGEAEKSGESMDQTMSYGSDKAMDKSMDHSMDKGMDKGMDHSMDKGMDHSMDKGMDHSMDSASDGESKE